METAITGKIQNELWRLGYKCCTTQRLYWTTDKPIHAKSVHNPYGPGGVKLDEPYRTKLGYKTACKLYEELRQRTV
jgi:hypothetical protein